MASSIASISEQVAEHKAAAAGQMPPEVSAVFAAEQATLTAAGTPRAAVAKPGATLPDTPLLDAHGAITSLHAVTQGRPAVLVFYRGAWCPYCNIALSTYREQLAPQLAERDVALVAISPQKPDGSLTMQEKNELDFAVVSEPDNALAAALGILTAPSDDVLAVQVRFGIDLKSLNADETVSLPMPTVVILDAAHTIRWIDVHPDYTTRTEAAEILDALDSLLD
jgi:peroxiredoxin